MSNFKIIKNKKLDCSIIDFTNADLNLESKPEPIKLDICLIDDEF